MSYNNGPKIVTSGLVLYLDAANSRSYPGSGSVVWRDLTQTKYTGSLTNGPTYNASNNGSIVFDGSNDNILFGDILDLSTNDMTINIWSMIDNTSASDQTLLSKSFFGAQNYRYSFGYNSSRNLFTFFQGNGGADVLPLSSTVVPLNTWHMVTSVITRSSSIRLYINAIQETLVGSATISQWNGLDFQSNNPFRIGSYTFSDNTTPNLLFNGKIAIVQVYFRSLSPSEIRQNYHASKGRFGL